MNFYRATDWTVSFDEVSDNNRWPKHLRCCFNKLSFIDGIHNKVEFSVTEQQQLETTAVLFNNCSAVDFIDIGILKRFPNLNGLKFFCSNILVVENIFTVELKMIQYLSLGCNKIKKIKVHVFDELVELKWIDLSYNEIEEILHPIFAKNKKLEFIYLSNNKIH
jgi:Leucine-rich repeat (LRR) protein